MLCSLHVTDLALIEELALSLGAGLNVVTGETGAGKSLLQRALAAAVGHRVGGEMVRTGSDAARIEASFDLADAPEVLARLGELGIPLGDERTVLVRRTIPRSGRGQAWINDQAVTIATLIEVGRLLVHLQGQHESLRLAQAETHLAMLDAAIGSLPAAAALRASYDAVLGLIARLDALERGAAELERRLEIARYDLDELRRTGLDDVNEETLLAQERSRLRNGEKLAAISQDVLERLHAGEGAALAAVESAARRLGEAAALDPALGEIAASLELAAAPLGDAVRTLLDYADGLEADPHRLEEIEDRLALLARLRRKHGAEDIAALLARRDGLAAEIERAALDVANPEALRGELERAAGEAWRRARDLSELRHAGAETLSTATEAELAALGMPDARFSVQFEALPAGPARGAAAVLSEDGIGLGADGFETVEFYLAANPGEGARPLARIASGGELSRIMLALRHVAGSGSVPTLVFDEVDAGIGGVAAEIVGRRLRSLAARHQIVCITHLAQIAAFADRHYAVAKRRTRGRTLSEALLVDGDARVEELARMIGGAQPGVEGLRHAAEMLRRAAETAAADVRQRDLVRRGEPAAPGDDGRAALAPRTPRARAAVAGASPARRQRS